jgi:hypothetical protein
MACSFSARAEVVSAISASSGIILANISALERTQSDLIAKNFDFKWLSFQSRILAAVGEFQVGLSPKFKITQLMETRAGVRYFPFAYGADFENFHETSVLRYRAGLKPFAEAKVGYGRYVVSILDDVGSAETGSNYLSLGAALGAQYGLTQSISLDSTIDASFALGTSEILFSGLLIRPRFGILLYL